MSFVPWQHGRIWDWVEIRFWYEGQKIRDGGATLQDVTTVSALIQLQVGLNHSQLLDRLSDVCRTALERRRRRVQGFRGSAIHVRLRGLTGHPHDPDREWELLHDSTVAAANRNIRGISSRVTGTFTSLLVERGWTDTSQGAPVTVAAYDAGWWGLAALDNLTVLEISRIENPANPTMEEDKIAMALRRMGISPKY